MSYPTSLELAEFCFDARLIDTPPTEFSLYESTISAAIDKWESLTLWNPFIVTTDTQEVFREHRNDFLDFKGGFCSVTSVKFDNEATPAIENQDYELKPERATLKRYLRLLRYPAQTVTVTGKFGYATECPADVKQALLAYGAAQIASLLTSTAQLTEVKQGDVSYKYATGSEDSPATQYQQWLSLFNHAVGRYSRRSFM